MHKNHSSKPNIFQKQNQPARFKRDDVTGPLRALPSRPAAPDEAPAPGRHHLHPALPHRHPSPQLPPHQPPLQALHLKRLPSHLQQLLDQRGADPAKDQLFSVLKRRVDAVQEGGGSQGEETGGNGKRRVAEKARKGACEG